MPRSLASAAVIALCALAIGCGGGDDPQTAGPGADEAERAARDFLVSGVEGDVDGACGLLGDDLTEELESTIPCETLVEVQADLAKQGKAEFDSVKIDTENVDELELQTYVSDDGQSANVTGPRGDQNISLKVLNGEWVIVGLPQATEPGAESN